MLSLTVKPHALRACLFQSLYGYRWIGLSLLYLTRRLHSHPTVARDQRARRLALYVLYMPGGEVIEAEEQAPPGLHPIQ
ncbi:hypothetical protein JAAARDRAFT_491296 [Jaapia argillacea MUCL 33604]|uniref:Uncharacterized protein n=1 Tax=Jaapia argillacea MUCL 33604 TaxID=933084 RepID=A0A067PPC3_9AGAM|nr:hypothetical protein JAAARDRAFT_491296 [Jaapia argillacea MUCL 33604]